MLQSFQFVVRGAAIALVAALTPMSGALAAVATYTDFTAFDAASPAFTIESFDNAPWTPTGSKAQGTSSLGVTWTGADALSTFNYVTTALTALDAEVDTFDWLEAALPAGITAVGGWISSFNMAHDTELRAYDALDNLLGSVARGNTGSGPNFGFLGLVTDTDIARVRFVSTNVTNPIGDDFALDNFTFGTGNLVGQDPVAVPAPSALALSVAGLAGLALRRRARRSA